MTRSVSDKTLKRWRGHANSVLRAFVVPTADAYQLARQLKVACLEIERLRTENDDLDAMVPYDSAGVPR